MLSCPADEQLQHLIDDQLSADAERVLTAHIDTCAACQERLELLTRSAELPGSAPPGIPEASTALVDHWTRNGPDVAERWPEVKGYEILGELGRGGMGVVYRAWQAELKRTVALKMILAGAHADARVLARFRTEAEAAARLQHPNIVQVHDIGEHGGCPCLVLEYVDGTNLARRINGAPQPAHQAARLIEILARAVHYAHQQGVVHRDLKPANILLSSLATEDTENTEKEHAHGLPSVASVISVAHVNPKISDFGLAKLTAGGVAQTQSGEVMGTPSYMAPEQAAGKAREAGPATDVYALGAILYELLTGRPPFKAETPLETVRQVVQEEPVSVTRLQPRVPRDLETICLKCLQKEPARRYPSAEALADDLGRFLADEPIRARPVRAWERGVKWARRRPALAALAGVSLAAALCLAAGGVWYNARLQNEVRHRKVQQDRAAANLQTAIDVLEYQLNRVDNVKHPGYEVPKPLREDLLRHAVQFYEKLLADGDNPEPQARRAIGRAYFGLGHSNWMLGSPPQAEAHFRRAIGVQEQLLADFPNEVDYRIDLATTLLQLSYQQQGAEYAITHAKVVALVEALPPEHPRLGNMGAIVAQKLTQEGRLREALPWLDRHIGTFEAQEHDNPSSDIQCQIRRVLVSLYWTRAMLLRALGKHHQALNTWDRLLALGDVPGTSFSYASGRLQRALTLADLGDFAQALQDVDQAVGPTADGDSLVRAAAVCSQAAARAHEDASRSTSEQASLEDQCGARAVALLRRAQAAGCFAKPDQLNKLKTDPDFTPLRSRDDFQRLLTEAAAKPMR